MDREFVRQGTKSELSENIKPDDLVLDVGGGDQPLSRANFVLDFMPWEIGGERSMMLREVWPIPYFSEKTWIQQDICARNKWPFEDKKFDFVFCSHTLEDIRDPIWVCQEMMRVGKAGYIETPSRIIESMLGVERLRYCGFSHHHWLCELTDDGIEFMFKHAQLQSYSRFHISPGPSFGKNVSTHTWVEALDPICGAFVALNRWFRKVNPKYISIGMYWSGSFQCPSDRALGARPMAREVWQVRLAEDDRASRLETVHDGRVVVGDHVDATGRAAETGETSRGDSRRLVDVVLDDDGHTVQRAHRPGCGISSVELSGG